MQELKVGILGCGHISAEHLKGWRKAKGASVAGVFDLNKENAAKRAKQFGVATVFDTIDQLVAECDIVDICTPPSSHAALAMKALEAGKHLLIEKPMVIEESDWDAIEAKLREGRSKLAIVHNLKFGESVIQAKKLVDEGRIGKLIRIQREFLTHPRHDRMLTEAPHWSHKLPGGRWFETLPHELYISHYFGGPAELVSVAAMRTPAAVNGVRADEVTLTFQNDRCITTVHYSSSCEMNRRTITFTGTKGVIYVDVLSDSMSISTIEDSKPRRAMGIEYLEQAQRLTRALPDRARYLLRRSRGDRPHTRLITQFADYLHGKAESPTPLDEVDYVVRNCYRVGRAIDERFGAA